MEFWYSSLKITDSLNGKLIINLLIWCISSMCATINVIYITNKIATIGHCNSYINCYLKIENSLDNTIWDDFLEKENFFGIWKVSQEHWNARDVHYWNTPYCQVNSFLIFGTRSFLNYFQIVKECLVIITITYKMDVGNQNLKRVSNHSF